VTYDKERYANDPVYRAKLKAASKEWSDANRPRINARRRHRRVNDPKYAHAVREDWLKTAYGITAAEFNAMASDLAATLEKFKVPAEEQAELKAIVNSTRSDIVVESSYQATTS